MLTSILLDVAIPLGSCTTIFAGLIYTYSHEKIVFCLLYNLRNSV